MLRQADEDAIEAELARAEQHCRDLESQSRAGLQTELTTSQEMEKLRDDLTQAR